MAGWLQSFIIFRHRKQQSVAKSMDLKLRLCPSGNLQLQAPMEILFVKLHRAVFPSMIRFLAGIITPDKTTASPF